MRPDDPARRYEEIGLGAMMRNASMASFSRFLARGDDENDFSPDWTLSPSAKAATPRIETSQANMSAFRLSRTTQFVVLARKERMRVGVGVGVDGASMVAAKILELLAAGMEKIEVIDAPRMTYDREQLEAHAGMKRQS